MAIETNKFCVVKKKRLEKSQFNVECNVSCEVEIDKILSVCHTPQIESAEVLNGVVNYSGVIDLCVLYSTIDGEIGTINSQCLFNFKFEDENIKVGDKIKIDVEVEDYQIDAINGTSLKINCTCAQSGILILCREVDYVQSGDENICMKEDEMIVDVFVGQAKEIFAIESDVSIKEPIKKVLLSDSQVSVKTVESGVNFVSVGGEVVTRLLYLTESDRFESCYLTENFKEEIELDGATRESVAEAIAKVKKGSSKCELDSDEKGVNVKLTIPVEIEVTVYQEKTQTVVKDMYSTVSELEVSTQSFEMTRQLPSEYFETKIDGTLSLDEDQPRVDKIMFVGGSNLMVSNAYSKDGEVFVEGVAKTNVVYLNDETNSLHAVTIEVPFVVSEKTSVEENVEVCATAMLYDVDVVVKKGREFYFDAKLKVNISFDCDEIGAVISSVNMASEYPERDCAIELVFANAGQSAWDVAKAVRVSEQTIMLNNPEVVFPLEQDENIIVYYQKQN